MILSYREHTPVIAPSARVAENATLVGQVTLAEQTSIWYGAVLRGDNCPISIGAGSNIQDNAVCHAGLTYPVTVGKDVTVGHGAILHGCTIEDGALIGMGAILLNGCVVGAGSLVAAGALVTSGTVIPPGSLVMGSPAKVVRLLRPEELESNLSSARHYVQCAAGQLPCAAR